MGKDLTNTLTYFGSVSDELVKRDFTEDPMKSFTITKIILFESEDVDVINKIETKLISELGANNPEIGYNLWPKFKNNF